MEVRLLGKSENGEKVFKWDKKLKRVYLEKGRESRFWICNIVIWSIKGIWSEWLLLLGGVYLDMCFFLVMFSFVGVGMEWI